MNLKLPIAALALLAQACAPMWPYGVEPSPITTGKPSLPVFGVQLPADQINSACHGLFKDTSQLRVDGCALVGSYACVIVWPQLEPSHGYGQGRIDAIFQHETGHCRGLVHTATGQGWVSTVAAAR